MSGNKESSAKRIATIRDKYGDDFFAKNGALGGATWKGRKHTKATRRKISRTKRLQRKLNENN